MQIVKDKIYIVNKDTVEKFLQDVVKHGFIVRDSGRESRTVTNMLTDNYYLPMTFHDDNEYVYLNSKYVKQTMGEVLELIKEAKDTSHDIYRFNAGKEIVVYKSKKVLI